MIDLVAELQQLEKVRNILHKIFPGYISHIRFPRYKNIAPLARIEFSFPITALVGANGSGKTSVLNALYGAPNRQSTGEFWFSTKVDPIEEGEGSPNRFIYGHYNKGAKAIVETRKARVRKKRRGREDPNYWEPTKESPGDGMVVPSVGKKIEGRSQDRWNPVSRKVLYINFRKELSAFDKYFYFGKDPSIQPRNYSGDASKDKKRISSRRILTKMDQVRSDASWLARVIESGDTSLEAYGRKVATENRLLTQDELDVVSYVLGREYVEARWIRHRLFKGDGGLSVVFKTKHGRYSEAFAGSGEVAVTSCVVQVMAETENGTLVLLDEPEVSLHPGAQERLLAFLARHALQKKMQIIFSTHSPHLVAALPDDAIKTFHQLSDGSFSVIGSTHPYAAFNRLGATNGGDIQIVVEDRLALAVVEQALLLIDDEAVRHVFKAAYVSGGASSILNLRTPVFIESRQSVLVLLDGDQRKVDEITDPDTIPASANGTLEDTITHEVGADPEFSIDGGSSGGKTKQRIDKQRSYLAWARTNLRYIPTSCPEELILVAAGRIDSELAGNAQACKSRLQCLASEALGREASSAEADNFGTVLLGLHRNDSQELRALATCLEAFLASVA